MENLKTKEEPSLIEPGNFGERNITTKSTLDSTNQIVQIDRFLGTVDPQELTSTVKSIREALFIKSPIERFLDVNLVDKLVDIISEKRDNSELCSDAAWILTELALRPSDRNKTPIFRKTAVTSLVKLLAKRQDRFPSAEKVACALGELIYRTNELRDVIISCGAVKPIAELAERTKSDKDRADVVNVLLLTCRYPLPQKNQLEIIWPVLVRLLMNKNDKNVILEVLWTLRQILPNCALARKAVVNAGGVARLLELITKHKSHDDIPILALECIKHITSSKDLIQSVIDADALSFFQTLIAEKMPQADMEIIKTLKNITLGNEAQIKAVADGGFLPYLTNAFSDRSREVFSRRFAQIAFGKIVVSKSSYATPELLKVMCGVLVDDDQDLMESVLSVLRSFILNVRYEDSLQVRRRNRNSERVFRLIRQIGYEKIKKVATSHHEESVRSSASLLLRFIDLGFRA